MRTQCIRRWRSLPTWRSLLLVSGVAAAASLPGTALATTAVAGGVAGAATSGHTWKDYFYPLKVGWTCNETVNSGAVAGTETLTIAAIGSVPTGRSITVDESSSTTADGTTVPTNAALRYILTTSGGLVTIPSSGQAAGQAYRIEGDTAFPSVHALLSGGSSTSSLHLSAPLSASDLTEMKAVLPANATGLDMAVTIRQSGTIVPTLHIPGATYHNALAVRSNLKSISITNALKSAASVLNAAIKPELTKDLSSTTWYALGRGPVKISLGGITGYVTSCGMTSSPTSGAGGAGSGSGTAGNSGGATT